MQPDNELLRQYAKAGSESAFAELVKRHVNLVYSAALRQVGGDAHLAHDVAQTVFCDLARKASALLSRESLSGWLYTSAFFAANKMARKEIRRRAREEQFMREPTQETPQATWETLRPILDEAMHGLKEPEREAVLLRYFENRPYAEVGAKLGINENTARMRVERALEKLRGVLTKRGAATGATLASVISANAVQVAPPALAATLTNGSLAAAAAGSSFALFKLMTLTQLKVGLGAVVVAGAATTMVLQYQAQKQLRTDNDSLRDQIAQLKNESQDAPVTNTKAVNSDEFNELLRLRGEVGALRAQTNQLAKLKDENNQLREGIVKMAQQPKNLPTGDPDAEQRKGYLQMNTSREYILGMIMHASEHDGLFPTNFDQLTPYLKNSQLVTNMNRFEMVYTGPYTNIANPSSAIILREIEPWPSNGKWMRTYGFADGHSEVHTSPTPEGFSEWEQQHVPLFRNP